MPDSRDPLRRRNHFVPVSYLAGFTDSGRRSGTLAVYDRTPGAPVRLLRPTGVATARDLYVRDAGGGELDDQFERFLAESVEGPFAPIRDRLAFGAAVGLVPSLDAFALEERRIVTRFVAYQMLRTPEEREAARWMAELSAHVHIGEALEPEGTIRRQFEAWRGRAFSSSELAELRGLLLGLPAVQRQSEDWLPLTVRLAERLADALGGMGWRLLCAPRGVEFVTCDKPVVCVRRGSTVGDYTLGAAIGESEFEATLSISPEYALYLTRSHPGEAYLSSPELAMAVRERTIRYARRWVYGRTADEDVQRSLQTSPAPCYYAQSGDRVFIMGDSPGEAYRAAMVYHRRSGAKRLAFRYGVLPRATR